MEERPLAPLSGEMITSTKRGLGHPLKALKRWDFRLLFVGQAVSSLGSTFQAAALAWMILSQRGSAIDLGLSLLWLTIPQALFTFAGGMLTDRLDARFVVLLADGMRILTAGALALVASNTVNLWLVWSILFTHGIGNALFTPAANSLVPRLVGVEDLESANALSAAMTQVGPFVGFFAAGFLLKDFGPGLIFLLNAGSYAVAVLTSLFIGPLERVSQNQETSVWHATQETGHYLRTVPWLLVLFLMDALVAFAAIATNTIGVPLLTMHMGTRAYGLLAGSYYGGGALGLLLSAWNPLSRSRRGIVCILCQAVEAALIALIAFTPFPLALCCMAAWSALNGMLVVLSLTLIQQYVPSNMIGRIMALWTLASTGVLPIAQVAGGIIANTIGAQALFALAGCIVLFGAILGGCSPALRTFH